MEDGRKGGRRRGGKGKCKEEERGGRGRQRPCSAFLPNPPARKARWSVLFTLAEEQFRISFSLLDWGTEG